MQINFRLIISTQIINSFDMIKMAMGQDDARYLTIDMSDDLVAFAVWINDQILTIFTKKIGIGHKSSRN